MLLRYVMLKFQKDLTSSFWVFAPTRKRDAGQNPGATKIPLPLRVGDKNDIYTCYKWVFIRNTYLGNINKG